MSHTLEQNLRRALAERVRYYHELGIYDFYRRESRIPEAGGDTADLALSPPSQLKVQEEMPRKKFAVAAPVADENIFQVASPKLEHSVADPVAALRLIREDLGDC